MWVLLWAMISLDEASGMSICPSAPWWQLPPFTTMGNNRSFMDDEGGCEEFRLYMEGIPENLIHPRLSKLSPGGWCGQVYITAKGDLEVFTQEVLNVRRVEKLLRYGKTALLFFSLHPSLFVSPPHLICSGLFSWDSSLKECPVYVWHKDGGARLSYLWEIMFICKYLS